MQEYLTIPEVMAILKITRRTLHRLTKAGKIPAYTIGGGVRYKREDVEKSLIPKEIEPKESENSAA